METLEMGGDCKPLTTFVHADTSTFREVVQRLTGAGPNQTQTQNPKSNAATGIISSRKTTTTAASMSKLHERRQYIKPKLDIVKPTIINSLKSSSPLVSPSTIFSKLSIVEQQNRGGSPAAATKPMPMVRTYEHEDENRNSHFEEEKAIQERRFYLHPSPRQGRSPRSPPELLTLFPLTSPKSELQNP